MAKEKKGKVITITSMKGGVGKTTTTLLLASIYEKMKKKVLIVDLDLYCGSIAFILNLDVKNTIYNICDDMNNNRYKGISGGDYITSYDDYIDVLAAPKDPRFASKIYKKGLELLIQNLNNYYDVILIDTNHILDMHSMVAFDSSDKIVDIFTNDALDLKGTKTFNSICTNVGFNNLVLVMNESIGNRDNYFSNYDIKSLINHNIDFIIPSSLNIKNIDMYIMEGNLLKYFYSNNSKKSYSNIEKLALKLLEDNEKGNDEDEKE